MESNVGDMVCGRCGYRGEGFHGRSGGFRCYVCFKLQGGYVPPSPDDEEWGRRVREALGIPEPKLEFESPDDFVLLKYGGVVRRTPKRS